MKVLLSGYYGFGNFGDDVLFRVASSLTRTALPDCEIFVRSASPSAKYLHQLDSIQLLCPGAGTDFDLIVHGGGGTFFDFKEGEWHHFLLNRAALSFGGKPYSAIESALRHVLRRPRDRARLRIGLGLGIGTFTASSRLLRLKLPALLEFDSLMVRDQESLSNLAALNVAVPAVHGSDIAFLHEHWWECRLPKRPMRMRRPKVGVVLRDWATPDSTVFSQHVLAALAELRESADLTFFYFDREGDVGSMALTRSEPSVVVWQPQAGSFLDFGRSLAEMDVLITSRAHGAICGAVLGVPSLLVDIEPKLRAVHKMLPASSHLVSPSASPSDFTSAVAELLQVDGDVLRGDVERNRARAAEQVRHIFSYAKDRLLECPA